MARMSIDDKFLRDGRVKLLGQRLGWSRRETMGALLDVFAVAYDQEDDVIPVVEVDAAADKHGFALAMVEVNLADPDGDDVRIKGAAERIEYLAKKREAGAKGGRKSGETRRKRREAKRSTASEAREAFGNPPDLVPDSVPVPERTAPLIAPPGGQASLAISLQATPPPEPRAKKQPTGDHQRVIAAFEARYSERYEHGATWGAAQGNMVKLLLAKQPADEVIRRIGNLFDAPPHFLAGSAVDLSTLVQHFDKLVTRAGPRGSAERASPRTGRVEPRPHTDYPDGDQPL